MTVPYGFETTLIHLAEFNAIPEMLTASNQVIGNHDFSFLADPAGYVSRQRNDQVVLSDSFVCQPFPASVTRNSSFWNRYVKSAANADTKEWDLQLPFYARLRKQKLEVMALPEKDRANVSADSYLTLNALGWTTHVNLLVRTSLRPSQVVDLCNNLRDKAYGMPAYRLNGAEMTLKDIFLFYRKTLMKEILAPNVTYNRPPHIPHLVFVDVIDATGEPTAFPDLSLKLIEVFANIIKRNQASVSLQQEDGGTYPVIDQMLITKIDPEFLNFSLTDFDQGTFTFLQAETIGEMKTSKPYCYALNTRDAYLVSYLWLEAYRSLYDQAPANPAIAKLLESGRAALKYLKKGYSSRTSLRLWQNHKGLESFLKSAEPVDEGGSIS